jgi:predicted alpha/beta superfamily hydrolase
MKTFKFLVIILLFGETLFAQNAGDIIVAKRMSINSAVLGEDRTIYVSTPYGYSDSTTSFPVMYVLDGDPEVITFYSGMVNNLFSYDLCPEMIIVAIENTERIRDMAPSKPKYDDKGVEIKYYDDEKVGEADKFLSFIETELFPFMNRNYRTIPYRIFAGHSASAMCVTHAFLSHTNMFNAYIAMSPSLYWDSGLLNRTAEEKIGGLNLTYKQYYFSIGGDETPSDIEEAHTFAQTLKIKSPAALRWKFDYIANEDHGSQVTIALYNSLRFIYEGWKYDNDKMVAGGLNAINSFYQNLTDRYGYEILPDGNIMNSIGWEVKRSGRIEEAIKILEDNTRKHPDFPEAYSYLAEVYSGAGNYEFAIKSIKKAVELATVQNDDNLKRYKIILDRTIKASKK